MAVETQAFLEEISPGFEETEAAYELDAHVYAMMCGNTFRVEVGDLWGEEWEVHSYLDEPLDGAPVFEMFRFDKRLKHETVCRSEFDTASLGIRRTLEEFRLRVRGPQHFNAAELRTLTNPDGSIKDVIFVDVEYNSLSGETLLCDPFFLVLNQISQILLKSRPNADIVFGISLHAPEQSNLLLFEEALVSGDFQCHITAEGNGEEGTPGVLMACCEVNQWGWWGCSI